VHAWQYADIYRVACHERRAESKRALYYSQILLELCLRFQQALSVVWQNIYILLARSRCFQLSSVYESAQA
jgi:hypothetical protein